MGILIEDGKGSGHSAEVNDENELVTRSINQSELEHSSGKNGRAYSWTSANTDIDAGDTRLYVRNDGNIPLILDRITFNGGNVICQWTIAIGEETTTPAGTIITGANLNQSFGAIAPDATAYDDETSVADGTTVDIVWTPVTSTIQHNLDGIILGKNHYIQINQETESTSGQVILVGHFENPS
jgi:hypothetical protein